MEHLKRAGQYVFGFLLFLLIWWGGSLLVGPSVLPPPTAVAVYLRTPGVFADFFLQAALTAGRGILGFSLAWLVALPFGSLMGRRESGERIGFFPLFLLQSAPPLFWVTPLVLWLGTRGMVPSVIAFFVSLPLLMVHTLNAVKAIPEQEYDVFSIYAPRRFVIARELYIPHLLPALKSNIHLGVLVAIKASMLGEWFAAQDGFGRAIRLYYQFFAMTEFLSWALLFLVVVGGFSLLLKWVLDRFLPSYRPTSLPKESRFQPSIPVDRPQLIGSCQLAVNHLTFGYKRTPLFQHLSFCVDSDRSLVIFGESGCGKTTLLKCLAGVLKPWAGTIHAESSIGLIFQDDALLSHRDALGNVLLPAFPQISTEDIRRARESLELWGLGASSSLFPHELSGGMRKRLAMAREWFRESSVLLLDEPFVNLDRESRSALWTMLFERLRERRIPSVIVTHYPEEISDYPVNIVSWESFVSEEMGNNRFAK